MVLRKQNAMESAAAAAIDAEAKIQSLTENRAKRRILIFRAITLRNPTCQLSFTTCFDKKAAFVHDLIVVSPSAGKPN